MSQTSWEFGNLLFGSHNWLTIAIVLAVVVGLLTIWSYFRTPANLKQYRFATILLKVAGGGLLAFCLLEPMQRTERPLPGANVLALVVDNSQSMQIRPEGVSGSRADLVRQSLGESLPWQQRIAQDFDVRRYAFDERLHVENNYADLQFDGKSSSLAGAIDTLGERFSSRPVAGALLFTDGVATDDVARILESGTSNFPIYPIVSGSDEVVRDISITESSTSVSPFELAPASVEVTVNAVGFAGEELTVRLY
ncbi:MAG: vWA domain-containing protein, partial [Planctomycetota bacterium]